MKFFKANKEKVSTMESELTTTKQTLANVETEFVKTKDRLAALEANPPAPRSSDQKPADPNKPTDFFEDPEKALFERVKPLADYSLQQGAMIAQMKLEQHIASNKGKFGDNVKLYSKYQKEIEELMKKENPVNQSNPQAWFNAFVFIKGLHEDEIQDARTTNNTEFFGEPSVKTGIDVPDKSDEVTPQDKKMAEKFGSFLKPEDLVAARKNFTYVKDEA